MRSITVKLTAAFLLVGVSGAILVALIVWQRTQNAFNQFLLNREQQVLVDLLSDYYAANGAWTGVAAHIQEWMDEQPGNSNIPHEFRRDWLGLTLVDLDQLVVFSITPGRIGKTVAVNELDSAITLRVNGQEVGWLLLDNPRREVLPASPEALFLANVNSAALVSALIAGLLALSLGSVLAYTLTRSLRELIEATVDLAQGKLGRQVQVRSKDELGELAASFNKMSTDLERATQARRQMTADIAHDLRSPLSVISGYAEALSDGKLPGSPEIFAMLHQETVHLNRLVEDLRTLSLADAGELTLTLQAIQPQLILERAATRHAVIAQQKALTVHLTTDPDLPEVLVDAERLAQVLDNLLQNAFRHTPAGGEVRLAAYHAANQVILQVQDTGEGIQPADLPRIFDRFYRGDQARQHSGESGLGLAIARSIIEAHGGKIWAENNPNGGACFKLSLPVAAG